MKKIIILSYGAALPNQNASALRISSVVEALIQFGYDCYVIGQAPFKEGEMQLVKENYHLFSIYNYSLKNSYSNKIKTFLFPTKKIFGGIDYIIDKIGKVDTYLIYQQLSPSTTRKIVKYIKKNNYSLFFDVVEYQTISQQNLFTFFQFYIPNVLTVRKWTKFGGVISISSYLNNLFLKNKKRSIFVPFFFDVKNIPFFKKNSLFNDNGKIEFVYAGCPSRGRDSIVSAIKGFLMLPPDFQKKVSLKVAGAPESTFMSLGLSKEEFEKSKKFTEYLGKVPHETIVDIYKTAKFSLYLKPAKKRFSKAGFPTKVSESWALGTPVIANISGDIGAFIKDGVNGIIISDDTPSAFSKGVKRIFELCDCDMKEMSNNSRKTADMELSLDKYGPMINDFISGNKDEKKN